MTATTHLPQATTFQPNMSDERRLELISHLETAKAGDVVVLHVNRHHPLLLDRAWPMSPAIGPAISAAIRRGAWVGFDGDPEAEARWYCWFARWRHTAIQEQTC